MNKREERIREWIDTLDAYKIKDILTECIMELIYTDTVVFYDDTEVPYWDATGDRLDESDTTDK